MKPRTCLWIIAAAVMASPAGYAAVPVDADDFEHDTVGSLPTKPTEVIPASPTAAATAEVVGDASNSAGSGKGLRFHDDDSGTSVWVEYEFTRIQDEPPAADIPNGLISAARVDLSFAPLSTTGTKGDHIKLSLGEWGADLIVANDRFIDCQIWDNGTIDFVSVAGYDSTGHSLMASGNTLSIFANDYEESFTYTGPDDNPYVLPANKVAYWLNGSLITFGSGQGYTAMDNQTTANGTLYTSDVNIGRFGIVSTAPANGLDYVFDDILVTDLDSEQVPTNTSWLVQNSYTGLVYAGYANEAQANAVNTVPDYSTAGYKGGGVPIPFVPAAVTLSPSGGDDTTAIQNAINQVAALPVGPDGFRGAVVLEAGDYTVSSTLQILSDGVVIRGAGSQESGGTRITYTANVQSHLFSVSSSADTWAEVSGTRRDIMDSFVPSGAKSFNISDASGYAPGDLVTVQNTINQAWLDDRSDMSQWGWDTGSYSINYRRKVTAVNGNTITVDAPLVQTIEDQYGGGDIYKSYSGQLQNIGFESLRLESTYASDTDEDHGWHAIRLSRVRNGWVRQVTAQYFVSGCVTINGSSLITVEDCAMLDHKGTTAGGRRYSFSIDESDRILFQRCLTRNGRHDYVSGSRTAGPNVWVDCRATETVNDIGPHHRYATGELYDNIMGGEMNVQNRSYPNGTLNHGWSGAEIMFWNCDAASIVCDAPTGAMNWVVGSTAVKRESHRTPYEPYGIWDSENQAVTPRSLYYMQLADRLGTNALNNVILPEQNAGNIWSELFLWDGDGLFGDGLLALAEADDVPSAGYPFAVRGVVRSLPMLDSGVTASWSKVSGPGSVTFADPAALQTSANCSLPGTYVLQLIVDDGVSPVSNTVTVTVDSGGPDMDPPAAPADLEVTAEDNVVRLNWEDNPEMDLAGYNVYRSTTPGSYGTPLVTGLTSSDYTDNALINGTTYYYKVTAVDISANESAKSAEVSALPDVISGMILFGTANEGLAGFTSSTTATTESWSVESTSVRYINNDLNWPTPDVLPEGPHENGSLLRLFILDRSVGASYTMEGIVTLTDGYADDNNRVGIYLFGDVPDVAAGLQEDELGALYLRYNTDTGSQLVSINEGLDGPTLASETKNGGRLGEAIYGTTLTFKADIDFVDVSGTTYIDVTFTMTDDLNDVTTISTQVLASEFTGDYFGFGTRGRNRGVTSSDRNAPFTMDYRSFKVTGSVPLEGYDLWHTGWGTEIGGSEYDFDDDGLVNLYEYGVDGDPTDDLDRGTPPVITNTGSALMYVHPQRSDDSSLVYTVETTTNLISGMWSDGGYTVEGTDVTGGTLDYVTNSIDTAEDERFIRLRIEQ